MNLYHVTLWDPEKRTGVLKAGNAQVGGHIYLSIVAANDQAALAEARRHKGEITNFKLDQTGLIVV